MSRKSSHGPRTGSRPAGDQGGGPADEPSAGRLPAEVARFAASVLEAALEAIAAPAFVVRGAQILHTNPRGATLLAEDPARVRAALGDGPADPQHPQRAVRFTPAGGDHDLTVAVVPDLTGDALRRAGTVGRRWGLTPRQAAVLALVAQGGSNRGVAEALGCSEKTVELHVSALLAKTRCESRSQLVAAFWTDRA